MCGAVSGFHALVSSGTTPKMLEREKQGAADRLWGDADETGRHRRPDRSGVSLDPKLYYDINVAQDQTERFQKDLDKLYDARNLDPLYEKLGNADPTRTRWIAI